MISIRRINPWLAGLLAAGGIAFALPPAAAAQPAGAAQAHEVRGGHGSHGAHGGMRMLRRLDLTQEQRDQVFKIFHEQAPALRDRMQAARTAQKELRAMALSTDFDSAKARSLADTAAKAQADAALMRAEGMSKMFALLTPEQRTRLQEARERGPHHRGRR